MVVEVFKTNVTDMEVANKIISDLSITLPQSKINFDLTDCDNILRIETAEAISGSGTSSARSTPSLSRK